MKSWIKPFLPALKFIGSIMQKVSEISAIITDWIDRIIIWVGEDGK